MKEYIPSNSRKLLYKKRLKLWVQLKCRHILLSSKPLAGEFSIFSQQGTLENGRMAGGLPPDLSVGVKGGGGVFS